MSKKLTRLPALLFENPMGLAFNRRLGQMTSRSSIKPRFFYDSKLIQSSVHHTCSFQKSFFSTTNTAKAAKMCRNTNLVYQKFMWVNQAKYQVITDKYEQDSAACNLCSDTKPPFFTEV